MTVDGPHSMSDDPTLKPPDGAGAERSVGDVSTLRAEAQRRRFRVGDLILGRYKVLGDPS